MHHFLCKKMNYNLSSIQFILIQTIKTNIHIVYNAANIQPIKHRTKVQVR